MYTMYYLLKYDCNLSHIQQLIDKQFTLADLLFLQEKTFLLSEREKSSFINLRTIFKTKVTQFKEEILDSIYFLASEKIPLVLLHQLYQNDITTLSLFKQFGYQKKALLNISKRMFEKIIQAIQTIRLSEYEKYLTTTMIWIKNHPTEKIDYYYAYMRKMMSSENVYYYLTQQLNNKTLCLQHMKLGFYENSISDVLNINHEDISILVEKMHGETLQSIGDKRGLTRERIRQKLVKLFNLIGELKEDTYQFLFENFDVSYEDLHFLYNESIVTYYYLNTKYTKGSLASVKILEYTSFDAQTNREFLAKYNQMYDYYGKVVPLNYSNIFTKCVAKYQSQYFDEQTVEKVFYEIFYQYYPLNHPKDVVMRGLIDRNENIIFSHTKRFRYFEIKITPLLINTINKITNIPFGLYGAGKIYEDNQNILKQFDIRDGYELCDLCSRFIGLSKLKNIKKIHRRSEIQIGSIPKEKFVENYLLQHKGMSIYEIMNRLSQNYGLNRNSMLSYIGVEFSHYIIDKHIQVETGEENEIS